jgi:hypothetical protein
MHATKVHGTTFIHDGDLATVSAGLSTEVETTIEIVRGGTHMPVPLADLLEFVAEYFRAKQIAALESADWRRFLPDTATGKMEG